MIIRIINLIIVPLKKNKKIKTPHSSLFLQISASNKTIIYIFKRKI